MLFATSLARKLGSKGLTAVSLHPGVAMTNLSNHIDWSVEYAGLRASKIGTWDYESANSTLGK